MCGETARRVEGEEVFQSLHGFKRLILRNLGCQSASKIGSDALLMTLVTLRR